MAIAKISTTGMHCPSCTKLVEMSVGDLPGVASVEASLTDSLTTVDYDPTAIAVEAITEEIRKAGYGAEILG